MWIWRCDCNTPKLAICSAPSVSRGTVAATAGNHSTLYKQIVCVSALLTHLEMVWWRTPLHQLGTVAPGSPRWAGRHKLHLKRGVSCSYANACALVSFFWYSILLSRAWFCPVIGRHTTPKIPWVKWAAAWSKRTSSPWAMVETPLCAKQWHVRLPWGFESCLEAESL